MTRIGRSHAHGVIPHDNPRFTLDGYSRFNTIFRIADKIVQGAVAEVLSAIYEADFLDCSFGFRPRRSAHQALRVVREAITTKPVNWLLDADIRRYLDTAS